MLSAKGVQFNASLGQRPRIRGTQRNAPALKARFTSESFHSIIDAMPQSLSKVIVHIIFSTKDRESWLGLDVRPRMHAYLAPSAVISVPKWCALAASLIMFTLSRRCREPFPKLN